MATGTLIRIAALAMLTATAALPKNIAFANDRHGMAVEPQGPVVRIGASDETSRFVPLGIGKSVVIDLPRDVKDVLVADPKIANAVVRSARRAYIIGVTVGQTNVYFFDAEGRQIAGFDLAVTRDLNGLRGALKRMLPGADIRVEGIGDSVMLSGSAANPGDAQQAFELASRLAGDATKVVNSISVRGRDQVLLKVTVAEVQRDVIKQLGIDLNGSLGYGTAVVNFNNNNPFSATGQPLSGSSITPRFGGLVTDPLLGVVPRFQATIRAMERAGVIRTLAEPSLTAISGETATFVAGGEFPIPSGLTCDASTTPPRCQPQIDFKKFGVSLGFTPVVLSEGRISMRVMTEVSELSTDNAISLGGGVGGQSLTVPSIRARRAETVVEIPSGGAMALAGMIQESTKQQINGLPGLMQLPVLGTLFKSRDYVNRQSELMILVTPYVVRAVKPKDLSKPDDGFADVSDPSAILLGRLNRIYGIPGKVDPVGIYHGKYGFILD